MIKVKLWEEGLEREREMTYKGQRMFMYTGWFQGRFGSNQFLNFLWRPFFLAFIWERRVDCEKGLVLLKLIAFGSRFFRAGWPPAEIQVALVKNVFWSLLWNRQLLQHQQQKRVKCCLKARIIRRRTLDRGSFRVLVSYVENTFNRVFETKFIN